MFFFIFQSVVAQATTLSHYGYLGLENEGFQTFTQKHPDVIFDREEKWYNNDTELVTALLTHEFTNDMYLVNTMFFNWNNLMNKGFCMDLSDSEIICQAVERMWPKVAEQCIRDGKVYAVPVEISFQKIRINAPVWEEAGLSLFDAPQSFPELIEALDYWCDLLEDGDAPEGIRVDGMFEPSLYGKGSYVFWLVSKLIDSYVPQQQFMDQPLDFKSDELLHLVQECQRVGKRLYELEPDFRNYDGSGIKSLITQDAQMSWPKQENQVMSLRLNDGSPKCITTYLGMWAINPGTSEADLAIELLERLISEPESEISWDYNLLFRDAEPKPNPNYEYAVSITEQYLHETEQKLARDDVDDVERNELEDELAKLQKNMEELQSDNRKYLVTQSQLDDYANYADYLYFPEPGVFQLGSEASQRLDALEHEFAEGVITAEQMLREMGRIAQMVQLENEE